MRQMGRSHKNTVTTFMFLIWVSCMVRSHENRYCDDPHVLATHRGQIRINATSSLVYTHPYSFCITHAHMHTHTHTHTALLPSQALTHTPHTLYHFSYTSTYMHMFPQAWSCSPPLRYPITIPTTPLNLTQFFTPQWSQWCGEQKDTQRHQQAHQEEIKQALNILSGHTAPHFSYKVL